MNKSHCDNCDQIIDPYRKWCEFILDNGKKISLQLNVVAVAKATPEFCKKCWHRILAQVVSDLER